MTLRPFLISIIVLASGFFLASCAQPILSTPGSLPDSASVSFEAANPAAMQEYQLALAKEAGAIAARIQKAVKTWQREAKTLAIPREEQSQMAEAFKI